MEVHPGEGTSAKEADRGKVGAAAAGSAVGREMGKWGGQARGGVWGFGKETKGIHCLDARAKLPNPSGGRNHTPLAHSKTCANTSSSKNNHKKNNCMYTVEH